MEVSDFRCHMLGKSADESLRGYLRYIGKDIDIKDFLYRKLAKFIELPASSIQAYPNMTTLIRDLSAKVPLALVTNSERLQVDKVLQALNIEWCFDVIVSIDDVNAGKPSPDCYFKALQFLDVSIDHCVVVEDSPVGISAAKAAGIECIAVTNTHESSELGGADLIVSELTIDYFINNFMYN